MAAPAGDPSGWFVPGGWPAKNRSACDADPTPEYERRPGAPERGTVQFFRQIFKKMKHESEMRDSLHQTSDAIVAGLRLYR